MLQIGRRAKPTEVRARWAYSELTSPRFAATYAASRHLFDHANTGTDFDDLTQADKTALETVTSTERSGLWPHINCFSEFECQSWLNAQICQCLVLPALDPQRNGRMVPLVSFLASPRFPEATDPRNAADTVPLGTPFIQKEAICVIPVQGRFLIIDGTGRTILFLRTESLDDRLLVWKPV